MVRRFALFALSLTAYAASSVTALVYDPAIPQSAFAANEIVAAAGNAIPPFPPNTTPANCAPCVVLRLTPSNAAPQSYQITRANNVITVQAPDANGLMYGGLDIAEAIKLNQLDQLKNSTHTPHIARRGIKFNVPLDVRTPSYSDNADAAQANIPDMWSFDFWREFIDNLARHR